MRPLQLRLPPVPLAPAKARHAAAAWLQETGIPETAVLPALIAVSEIVTDALVREPADDIVVRAEAVDRTVEIEVESLLLDRDASGDGGALRMEVVSAVATHVSVSKGPDGRHRYACSVMLDR